MEHERAPQPPTASAVPQAQAPDIDHSPEPVGESGGANLALSNNPTGRRLQHAHLHQLQRQVGNAQVARRLAQRQNAPAAAPTTPSPQPADAGLIVNDDTPVQAGQMTRSAFLGQARSAALAAVDEELAGTPFAETGRAELTQQFAQYSGMDGPTLEQTIKRDVPEAAAAKAAQDYIPPISKAVRATVQQRLTTGSPDLLAGATQLASSAVAGATQLLQGIGGFLFKARPGGARPMTSPQAAQARLGPGQALDGGLRSGLEPAFGRDLSGVQVHTDASAAALADQMNARALTVGQDIAFGSGEYQPGTLLGDALIAHEAAHVIQQTDGGAAEVQPLGPGEVDAVEADADQAAIGAVAAIWGGARGGLTGVAANLLPTLRTGLSLQRCGKEKASIQPTQEALAKRVKDGMAKINTQQDGAKGLWYWPNYREQAAAKQPGFVWKEEYVTGYTTAPQWLKTGPFTWKARMADDASDAIKAWLAGLTVADCASAAVAVQYDAIRAAVGDEKFDDYFGGKKAHWLVISQSSSTPPLSDFLKTVEPNDLQEGDWYYFKNHPDYQYKHPAGLWQGEYVVYMGNGKWTGFGATEKTKDQMLKVLLDEYNGERTADDMKRLEPSRAQHGGQLPLRYQLDVQGGVKSNLGDDPKVIEDGGGGLGKVGTRLNANKVRGI